MGLSFVGITQEEAYHARAQHGPHRGRGKMWTLPRAQGVPVIQTAHALVVGLLSDIPLSGACLYVCRFGAFYTYGTVSSRSIRIASEAAIRIRMHAMAVTITHAVHFPLPASCSVLRTVPGCALVGGCALAQTRAVTRRC